IKYDYNTEPGHDLWNKIERYLETTTPRDQKIPEPVIVAPNQKADFNPHRARRTVRGSLEFETCDIPVVDLRSFLQPSETVSQAQAIVAQIPDSPPIVSKPVFKCEECGRKFRKEGFVRIHARVHKKVEQKKEEVKPEPAPILEESVPVVQTASV